MKTSGKYRDFSEMPDDVLRAFASKLAQVRNKTSKQRGLVHDPLAGPKQPIGPHLTPNPPRKADVERER